MSPRTRALSSLAISALVIGAAALSAGPATAATATPTANDLLISEIHPDNGIDANGASGPTNVSDDFEFFEITNTTDAAIDLAAAGIGVSYATSSAPSSTLRFAVSNGVAGDAVTPSPLAATVPAHGSTVFWLEYTNSGTLNTYTRTEADFRAFYHDSVPADAPIVRVEGQSGIANGGDRTLALVAGGQVVGSSYLPARTPTTPGLSTHLQLPVEGTTNAVPLSLDTPTPGTVTDAQLTPAEPPAPPEPPTPYEPVYPTPTISGTPSIGSTLTVEPGQWVPYDTKLDYQWFADGTPVAGATETTLKLSGKQKGARITVSVTGTTRGESHTTTSEPTEPVSAKG